MPRTFRISSMKTNVSLSLLLLITFLPLTLACSPAEDRGTPGVESGDIFELPPPVLQSSYSVEEALQSRRSIRRYSDESVDLQSVSQILWSAQGVTLEERGYRTAPSAGALFPLETYLLVGNVDGLPVGMYHYIPDEHHLVQLTGDDIKSYLSDNNIIRQRMVRDGAFIVVLAAEYERISGRYGERGIRYTHMEIGHAGQNIHLQAESLDLGTVIIGAFNDEAVKEALRLPDNIDPLYLMPVGKK